MIPVECIARGFLAGLGLNEYTKLGSVSGVPLPAGLLGGSRPPEPIFTPTTKSAPGVGVHDEFITFDDVVDEVGRTLTEQLRDLTLEVYRRGASIAYEARHHHRRYQA
jgi:phosphoribosylaminoimidazole-succinocarboxamide synthase